MHSQAAMSSLRRSVITVVSESRDTDSKARRSPPPHIGKRGLPGANIPPAGEQQLQQ